MTILACVAPALLAAASLNPGAGVHLLDEGLQLREIALLAEVPSRMTDLSLPSSRPAMRVATASYDRADEAPAASGQGETGEPQEKAPPRPAAPKPGSLDFDLLGAPAPTHQVDEHAMRLRRSMLTWHQGVGLGMFTLQLATTVAGQLNYNDKFSSDNTGRYVQTHAVLAYSTLAAFAAAGTLALLAPAPLRRDEGFDRVSLHKLSMVVATAGMLAQGVLGVWTHSREGYQNQQGIAQVHLAIGYVTLAAVATGVGALVF